MDGKAFFLASFSSMAAALVVHNFSWIDPLADLKGKKLAAAPVSTDHYQLLALIRASASTEKTCRSSRSQFGNRRWLQSGDLDGGFVWDPALTDLKTNGKVLVTSKEVADKGAPTFSAWVATAAFAKGDPGFLKAFAGVIDKYQTSFANDKAAWGPDSDNAKTLAKLLGGTPQDQASALKNLSLLPVDAQLSDQWLGGGEKSGIANILKNTSVFLKDQKKISDVLPSYAGFVTTDAIAGPKKPGT